MRQLTWSQVVLVCTAFSKYAKCQVEQNAQQDFNFPPNFCWIPGDRTDSRAVYLEDCPNLNEFKYLPKPVSHVAMLGVHPKVCCPKVGTAVLLSPGSEEEAYETYDGDYEEEYEEVGQLTKVSDQKCHGIRLDDFGSLTECVTLDRCPDLLDSGVAPQHSVDLCGFDRNTAQMMMCCPKKHVIEAQEARTQPPRFPDTTGNPRPVEDRTSFCSRWKEHGGCYLDRNFGFNGTNAGYSNDFGTDMVTSWEMFSFMQKACMGTCGWDNNKVNRASSKLLKILGIDMD